MQQKFPIKELSGLSDIVLHMHTTRESAVKFIIDRLLDLGLTPRAVSLALGKSATYLADFLGKKASPKVLPELVRLDLARILGTSEDNLKFQRRFIKDSEGITSDNAPTADIRGRHKRGAEMSLREIYKELIKLELRIERLETEKAEAAEGKGTRPPHGRKTS